MISLENRLINIFAARILTATLLGLHGSYSDYSQLQITTIDAKIAPLNANRSPTRGALLDTFLPSK